MFFAILTAKLKTNLVSCYIFGSTGSSENIFVPVLFSRFHLLGGDQRVVRAYFHKFALLFVKKMFLPNSVGFGWIF